jgi:hypothetical protein
MPAQHCLSNLSNTDSYLHGMTFNAYFKRNLPHKLVTSLFVSPFFGVTPQTSVAMIAVFARMAWNTSHSSTRISL